MMLAKCLALVIASRLVLLANGDDPRTPVDPQHPIVISPGTNDRHRNIEKDGSTGDNRQGRMALHAEAPSSKAKREQALRNILAARRRQLLGSRMSELPKTASPLTKTPRPVLGVFKDPLDMLEAQETRHGIYVTAPIGDEVTVIMENDEPDTFDFLNKPNSAKETTTSTSTRPVEIEESTKSSLLLKINETNSWNLTAKINETAGLKNMSQTPPRSQKVLEHENRRKNTVAMPESLYNHFRPVESNIPVEDMTQFLYFGQKLHPDNQNSSTSSRSSNNSVHDATSTSSTLSNSRRRYSKRFSTTTSIPVPRLEDIVNEEMNIALERSTIEKNKIPKIKNVFRSPGTGTYFRKSSVRTSDPTIVTNVIVPRETTRNSSVVSDNKRENVSSRNTGKFTHQSAHARQSSERDEGSDSRVDSVILAESVAPAHLANVTSENATDSTQFRTETEASKKNERKHQRGVKVEARMESEESGNFTKDENNENGLSEKKLAHRSLIDNDNTNLEMASTYRHETIDRITTWQSVDSYHESTTFSAKIDNDNDSKMTSSSMNDLTGTPDAKLSSTFPMTTSTSLAHSSLRIVVTEPMGYAMGLAVSSSPEDEEQERRTEERGDEKDEVRSDSVIGKKYRGEPRDTVNRADSRRNETRPALVDSHRSHEPSEIVGFLSTVTSINGTRIDANPSLASTSQIPTTTIESTLSAVTSNGQRKIPPAPSSGVPASTQVVKTEQRQHAYAYEITNVTRLLRNYTGPGLNVVVEQQAREDRRRKESEEKVKKEEEKEEEERNTSKKKEKPAEMKEEREEVGERGKEMERGSALTRTSSIQKIRNGGGSAQSTPQQRPLPLLLPTLQRAASSSSTSSSSGGIVEPARTSGGLSAGTDVAEATASSADSASDRGGNISGGGSGSFTGAGHTPTSGTATRATTEANRVSTARADNNTVTTLFNKEDRKLKRDEVTESAPLTSTLRWNHTSTNRVAGGYDRADIYGSDRRYFRKSASGVLSQRTVEEGLVKEVKRRRGSTSLSGGSAVSSLFSSSLNNRRKGWRIGVGEEDRISGVRSMENRAVINSDSPSTSKSILDEDVLGEKSDKFSEVSETMTKMADEVTAGQSDNMNQTVSSRSVAAEKSLEVGKTTVPPPSTLDSPVASLGEKNPDPSEVSSVKVDEAVTKTDEKSNFDAQVIESTTSASAISESTNDKPNDDSLTSSILTSTPSLLSSERSIEVTTNKSPVFPVTPRMLPEPSDKESDDEVSEVKPESVDETKVEASRPFGLAKDLDPSEIQKMYRSQTTLKPEMVMTTIIPDFERSMDKNPVTSTMTKETTRTMSPVNSSITRKPHGGERSPEVRGRNLSDKTKDNKDDILPIMQLYNTSNIFNGTNKDIQDLPNNVKIVELPGVGEIGETNEPDLIGTTTATATMTQSDISESTTVRKADDARTGAGNTRKNNNRQTGSRDEAHDNATTTRSSNNTNNGNSYVHSNRTRHRPNYYQTTTPDFIGYRPEFNATFFEPGMISVSPRESINISEVITKRHDGDTIATQETVAVVSYILATLVVFPIAVGVGLILRRLIIRNRKVLEESDTSSEISCRKDALNLENGDFKTSIEKAITKLPRIQHLCHEAEKPPPPPSQESRWEFPRDKLRLQTVLGQGNFGQVWKAEADDLTGHQGTTRLVAVKTVKEGASAREKEDLVRELEIMQQLGNHPNVVTLLGCCTEEEPHYLILEYVMYGKLLAYLRDHRTRQDFYNFSEDSAALTSRDLTVFGYCVARGMEYLASKKIIHRDLAARNVLVDHNKLCKIADFGMSRFANDDGEVIEARHGRNALPIRWMAPESLIYSLFTTKTDVWSFGILMWEIVTLGSTPYPDMAAREVMRNVQNGYRLERPSHCRSELFRVISRCWHADPDRRPEFQTLRRDMAQLLEDSMNGHYVDLESFASECTD